MTGYLKELMIPKPLLNLTVNFMGFVVMVICEYDLSKEFIEVELTKTLFFLKHFNNSYLYRLKYLSVGVYVPFLGRVHTFLPGLVSMTIALDIYICSLVTYEFWVRSL